MEKNANFRYDINALRAIAIIGVIGFHYHIPYFTGGFSGVDVFFVISGYLMTRIIITGLDNNSFTLAGFYAKRVKRIVPALLALLFAITLVGFFFFFPKDHMANMKNAAASVLFSSNFLYWKTHDYSNYFDMGLDNILFHTWSLSVEWQFYLLYPIALLLVKKLLTNKGRFTFLYGAVLLLFLTITIVSSKQHSHGSFYLLPGRVWEMMAGGLAFLTEGRLTQFRYRKALIWPAYAIILAGFALLTSNNWPGVYTLIPVSATFVILIFNNSGAAILRYRPIQFCGEISYSLYLWHWPVYALVKYFGVLLTSPVIACVIVASVLLAYLSYRFIELPTQFTGRLKPILVLMALVAGGTSAMAIINTNYKMFKPQAVVLSNYWEDHELDVRKLFRQDVCFIIAGGDAQLNKAVCMAIIPHKKNVLIIGDSHGALLYQSLQAVLQKQNINILTATSGGCYPIPQPGDYMPPEGYQECKDIMNYVYDDFLPHNQDKIDGVILCCDWLGHITRKNDREWNELKKVLSYFEQKKIPVAIIGQNKAYDDSYPMITAKEMQWNIKILDRYVSQPAAATDEFMKTNLGQYYIDIYDTPANKMLSPTGEPYMFDGNHYTSYGADMAVERIMTNEKAKKFIGEVIN